MSYSTVQRLFVPLFVSAFLLNWPWEMFQMSAYVETAGRSWGETALTCAIASLGDAMITLLVYAAAALIAGRFRWPPKVGWRVGLLAAPLGALVALMIEWAALSTNRWSYTERMPKAYGVGLWPVLQLTLIVPVAMWLASWWHRRSLTAEGK